MRGRQSMGMLTLLRVPELIAQDEDDYVRIATRALADPAWRKALAARIAAAQGDLFDVPDAIDRLQQFLEDDVTRNP